MHQHKDLLYRQKYATYKKKMLARNQLIMFSGRFKKIKKQQRDINYHGKMVTLAPPTRTRNFNERNYSFYHS